MLVTLFSYAAMIRNSMMVTATIIISLLASVGFGSDCFTIEVIKMQLHFAPAYFDTSSFTAVRTTHFEIINSSKLFFKLYCSLYHVEGKAQGLIDMYHSVHEVNTRVASFNRA